MEGYLLSFRTSNWDKTQRPSIVCRILGGEVGNILLTGKDAMSRGPP